MVQCFPVSVSPATNCTRIPLENEHVKTKWTYVLFFFPTHITHPHSTHIVKGEQVEYLNSWSVFTMDIQSVD